MGSGGSRTVEYVTDPALVKQLEKSQEMNLQTQKQMENMQERFARQTEILQKEKSDFIMELKKMKAQADKPKDEYDRIVKIAHGVVTNATEKVGVLLGAPGSGKSTVCKYMFGIEDVIPGEDSSHVTAELSRHSSVVSEYDLVDTVGKMPDVRGIMRVLACAYAHGWDPSALIVVDNTRGKTFDDAANFLRAGKINTVQFEPRSFWRMVNSGMDPRGAMGLTVFKDPFELPKINSITPESMNIEEASISEGLALVLEDLTWEKSQRASDFEGITISLAFYLAKSIAERQKFNGTDLQFIDMN